LDRLPHAHDRRVCRLDTQGILDVQRRSREIILLEIETRQHEVRIGVGLQFDGRQGFGSRLGRIAALLANLG